MIDTSNRQIQPIAQVAKYFDFTVLQNTDPIINSDADVVETVKQMIKIVEGNYNSVQKIANVLFDKKINTFLKNIFSFVMTYVQYEKDSMFTEQLRLPLRTLKDQKGDCDCMSILIGSILYAKNIPFKFRITKYNGKSNFQHVYVIVPTANGSYTVVDPVIGTFDKEKPFDEKKDFIVDSHLTKYLDNLNGMPLQILNGYDYRLSRDELSGLFGDIMAVTMGTDLQTYGLGNDEVDEMAIYNHLKRTRDVIIKAPQMFRVMKNPLEVARLLDYILQHWGSPDRDAYLDIAGWEEQRLLDEGKIVYPIADLSGEEIEEGLGFLKKIKKAFKKVGKGIKKVAKKVGSGVKKAAKSVAKVTKKVGKGIAKGAKAVGKGIVKGAKAVGKFVARFNPVSLAARGGLLLAIRKNMFKLADKLRWGLYTEADAQKAGIKIEDFRKMQEKYNKARKIFVKTLQGKESKFKAAIAKGTKHKSIKGLGELGELGVIAAATVTAAMGFITAIIKMFAGSKDPATGEDYTEENVTEGEVNDLMNESEQYDEDGNPVSQVNTSENPTAEDTPSFWEKAGNAVKKTANFVSNFIPSQNEQQYSEDDENEEYEDEEGEYDEKENAPLTTRSGSHTVTTQVMPGSLISNTGSFLKKNALWIGLGIVGLAGAVYLMRKNKPKKSRGLSGTPGKTTKYKKIKMIELQ